MNFKTQNPVGQFVTGDYWVVGPVKVKGDPFPIPPQHPLVRAKDNNKCVWNEGGKTGKFVPLP